MELRDCPRYRVYLTVWIDGIELTANNISSHGMQVSCPEFLLARIHEVIDQESYDIDIQLPVINELCSANVKTMYNSTYGEEQLIGIEFISLHEPHQSNLSSYLQGLADKNAPVVE